MLERAVSRIFAPTKKKREKKYEMKKLGHFIAAAAAVLISKGVGVGVGQLSLLPMLFKVGEVRLLMSEDSSYLLPAGGIMSMIVSI